MCVSRIASITIGGIIAGTVESGDSYGFAAHQIGSLKIGGGKITPANNLALVAAGAVRVRLL